MVGHMIEKHGRGAFKIYRNLLLEKQLSSRKLALLRKLTGIPPETTINQILQGTANTHIFCDNSESNIQNGSTFLGNSDVTVNPGTIKEELENNDNSESNIQNESTFLANSDVTVNPGTIKEEPENNDLKILGRAWIVELDGATDDNKNGHFMEPKPTLESIDSDLSFLCNYLGNDPGMVTGI